MSATRPIASIAQVTGLTAALGGKAASTAGVTNGNTHDHVGGDGAQIDYLGLANRVGLSANKFWAVYSDFIGGYAPWSGSVVAAGTVSGGAVDANHPGYIRPTSSTSANSGYLFYTTAGSLLLGGGETVEVVFRPIAASLATLVAYLGLQESSVTVPTDGAWLDLAGATLSGKTNDNTGADTTGTTYTVSAGVWYRGKVVVNADASRVDFYLYTCEDGALMWTNYLTTKISKTRATSCRLSAISTGTTALGLMDIDYVSLAIDRTLVR